MRHRRNCNAKGRAAGLAAPGAAPRAEAVAAAAAHPSFAPTAAGVYDLAAVRARFEADGFAVQ
jgi:hypothetical protein